MNISLVCTHIGQQWVGNISPMFPFNITINSIMTIYYDCGCCFLVDNIQISQSWHPLSVNGILNSLWQSHQLDLFKLGILPLCGPQFWRKVIDIWAPQPIKLHPSHRAPESSCWLAGIVLCLFPIDQELYANSGGIFFWTHILNRQLDDREEHFISFYKKCTVLESRTAPLTHGNKYKLLHNFNTSQIFHPTKAMRT